MALLRRRLREWVRLVRSGLPVSQAARRAGLTSREQAEALGRPRVAAALARAEEESLDRLEAVLFRQAARGDVRAAAIVLAAKRPETWRQAQTEDDLGEDRDGAWTEIAERMAARLESRDGDPTVPLLPSPPADASAGDITPADPEQAAGVISAEERTECPPSLPEPDAPPSDQSD